MGNAYFFQLLVYLCISFMSAFSKELNHYAQDKAKRKKSLPVLYISECMVATMSGFLLSIGSMIFVSNGLIHLLSAGIGGLAGRKLLFFFVKLGILIFSASKNIDISKLEDIEKTIKK